MMHEVRAAPQPGLGASKSETLRAVVNGELKISLLMIQSRPGEIWIMDILNFVVSTVGAPGVSDLI